MISVVYDVRRYRRLLSDTVRAGDVVVELGPHTGASTLAYVDGAELAVCVDKAEQSRRKILPLLDAHPNLRFVQADVRGFDGIRGVFEHTKRCDVFAVDLGGGRHADTVFKVWATWSGVFKPRDSIIRSRTLAEFVKRAEIRDDSLPADFPEAGWLKTYGRATPYKLKKQLEEFKHWIDINEPLE